MRTKKRRIELGSNVAELMRQVGLHARSGTGQRGDARRLRDQMTRLFHANISFRPTSRIGDYDRFLRMPVADDAELWWSTKHPNQDSLLPSWVELGEHFFSAITRAPVPLDVRVLRALKQSPLALDLYSWATYKAYVVSRKDDPEFISWKGLREQMGADYGDLKHFRQKVEKVMRKVSAVYGGFKWQKREGGFYILPQSTPSVSPGGVKKPVVIDL